jgi:competence/damage-inducible protein CinA-like protein
MKIEIVTTGDEVMQGVIVDTNTAWIAERCAGLGHEIVRQTAVGDDLEAIGDALMSAAARADCVIVSGGLGPTADDLTMEAAAKAFALELVRDEIVLDGIRAWFERAGRPMSKSNEKQALIPEGATVLENRVGTAPGIHAELGGADVFFLPGVPKELFQIFEDAVFPWLHERARTACAFKVLRCFGIPEASVDERLFGMDLFGARLSFRVKFPDILLKLLGCGQTTMEAQRSVDAAAAAIRGRLGDIVYGEGETSLAEVVGDMLLKRRMKLAVAESCTGGLVCSLITDVSGASTWFERGVVAYSNRAKEEILGVAAEILRINGAVSEEAARAMAEGVRRTSGAHIGVGLSGIAGPGGGMPAKPVGTLFIAVATPEGTAAHHLSIPRDRQWFKQMAAATALDLVRRELLGRTA